jgi:HK97 family phage major capsid protein
MPDLADVSGSAEPIVFGDFSMGYRIFDRLQLSVLRDPYSVQTTGQVRFHARRRVGGAVVKSEAFRKMVISS